MSLFKLAKTARNLGLANLFVWMSMDWLNIYTMDWYTAAINGLILFVFQYIVLNLGVKMTSNANNKSNSKLKNALICSGVTLNESISENSIRQKYSGRNVKILHGLPLVGLMLSALMLPYDNPITICWIFFFGSLALAFQPIYHAMVLEQQEQQV